MKITAFRNILRLCSVTSIFLLLCMTGYGQSDVGSIGGFIRDQSGAVIPNAKVTLRNEGRDESHTVVADSQGHYSVTNLPPAEYSMTVEASGFKKFVSTHNALGASTTLSL